MFTNRKFLLGLTVAGLIAGAQAEAAGLVTAGNAFHISGSTALDNQVKDALLLPPANGGPCLAGSISVYTDAPALTPAGPNLTKSHQATVVCTLAATIPAANGGPSIAAGTVVSFTKESNGGSNEGTFYPATQTGLAFFDATQAPVGCVSVGAVAAGFYWTHQQAIATEFDQCTGPNVSIIPDVGLADEDPALFTIGPQAVTPAIIASLNSTPLFQNQFALAVSLNLYRALQTAQGLTVNDDTLANMPTLSKSQIAGLYSGAIANWSQIGLASKTVFTCRRGDNSGTNVSADVYFLHNRCSTTGTPMSQATTSFPPAPNHCAGLPGSQTPENNGCTWNTTNNLGDATFAGAATGDVVSCLDAHARNGDYAFGPLGATSKFDDPNGASGVATEPGSNHWRYIAIDGRKPTVLSEGNGVYDYAFDNVENLWTGISGKPASVGGFLGSLFQSPVALTDILVAQPNAQSIAHVVDTNYVTGGLQDAFTPPAVNTPPVTVATMDANPTSAFTIAFGGSVNNCQVPLVPNTSLTKEVF